MKNYLLKFYTRPRDAAGDWELYSDRELSLDKKIADADIDALLREFEYHAKCPQFETEAKVEVFELVWVTL